MKSVAIGGSVLIRLMVLFGTVAALAIPDMAAAEDLRPPVVQDAAGEPKRISGLWPLTRSVEAVQNDATRADPNEIMKMALRLYDMKRDDDAALWGCIGVVRGLIVARAAPSPARNSEYSVLEMALGVVLSEPLAQDPPKWQSILDRAAVWNDTHDFDMSAYAPRVKPTPENVAAWKSESRAFFDRMRAESQRTSRRR